METGDLSALRGELGDVLLQVLFHARIAAERSAADGGFTVDDVADTLAEKLIRRHPHVFGSVSVSSADDVSANWEEIKKANGPRLLLTGLLLCWTGWRSGSRRCRWRRSCCGGPRGPERRLNWARTGSAMSSCALSTGHQGS